MTITSRLWHLAGASVLLLLVSAGQGTAQERIQQTQPAPADAYIQIHNVAGSVRVVAWDRAEVSVEGTLGEGTERLDFTSREGRVEIRVVLQASELRRTGRMEGSDLAVRVPAGSRLLVKTVSADVRVQGVDGEITVESVSGTIELPGVSGMVRAESISGDIVVEDSSGPLRAKSVSGRITIRQVTGRVNASTISGAISAIGRDIRDAHFESLSGNVNFEGNLTAEATLEMESHSGNLVLGLPRQVSAAFNITSFSGTIRNAFGPQAERTSRYGPGYQLQFDTGDGSARVRIRSFSGGIDIRYR
jgi:hypothetical protein